MNRVKERFNMGSLGGKMMVMTMSSTLGGLCVFVLAILVFAVNMIDSIRDRRINTVMDMMAENLAAPMMFEDDAAAMDVLSSIRADSSVLASEVRTVGGAFNVIYLNEELVEEYRNYAKLRNENVLEHREVQTYQKRMFDGQEEIGSLIVYVSSFETKAQLQMVVTFAFGIFCITAVLVFFISRRFQRAITQPIEMLSALSKKVSQTKDYSLRVSIETEDEIGQLSQDFNSMLIQVEQRDLMLESKVKTRTVELERLADEFRHRAFHDSLTGLPNRALLYEEFPKAAAHAKRINKKMGLLLLDLDNFKTINDTLGHDFGDELLKTFSKRLMLSLREEDLICRLGGDEFIILVEDLNSADDIEVIAKNIFAAQRDDIVVKNKKLDVGVSIGGALYPDHGIDITTLKRAADIAMYHSKDAGKNQFHLFQAQMEEVTKQRLIVQNDLKAAIEEEQLELYYQPKIDARNDHVTGCEVLVRWNHPHYGVLFPDTFIPFAEEAGHMYLIDHYVLERSFKQAYEWSEVYGLSMAINLSGAHFQNEKIIVKLRELFKKYPIDPSLIELEVTEAVLISDPDMALDLLTQIKSLGVKLALDDFGVGYSSLSYLRTFPVSTIKLDKSFIFNITTNEQDQRLTKGIISLAKDLEIHVVAEGVETEEHERFLKEIDCDSLQGYHYLKPSKLAEFEQWLIKWRKLHSTPPRNIVGGE